MTDLQLAGIILALAGVAVALAVRAWRGRRGSSPSRPLKPLDDGEFRSRTYTNPHGTRHYKLYVPPGGDASRPLPLLVMLHGCTQDADDIARGSRLNALALAGPCLVAYPQQSSAHNRGKCWNWFNSAHQRRDYGEPSLIAGITVEIMAGFNVDATRVYVAGLSAGGAMAVVMGATYPDLYAAVASHSGLAYHAARSGSGALEAMRRGSREPRSLGKLAYRAMGEHARVLPVMVIHGAADRVTHVTNGHQTLSQWAVANRLVDEVAASNATPEVVAHVTQGQGPGGYHYTRSVYQDEHGSVVLEKWIIDELGHAFSGGAPEGTYTDPRGPDMSREMLRFFSEHPMPTAAAATPMSTEAARAGPAGPAGPRSS